MTNEIFEGRSSSSSSSSSSDRGRKKGKKGKKGKKHRSSSSSSSSSGSRGRSKTKYGSKPHKGMGYGVPIAAAGAGAVAGGAGVAAASHHKHKKSGGYPPAPGYPPAGQSAPGYPPAGGYPGQGAGYPSYPPQPTAGYPGAAPGYPQAGAPGYPPNPSSAPGYPPAPGAGPGYPGAGPTPGYPPSTTGYPPAGGAPGYPPAGGAPGYPPAAGGYPPAAGGYPPAAGGYPPAASGYPPAQGAGYPPAGGAPGYGQQQPGGQPMTASAAPMTSSAAMFNPQDQPSIRHLANFDPSTDAALLRKAMKGFGTDEQSIINVLANRTNEQRQRIKLSFQQGYGKDLMKDLKKELGGNFERVVLAMMVPTQELLADDLHHAMKGLGTNENTLVEILCTKSNAEMHSIKLFYQQKYGHPIMDALKGETSGHFRRLLISMTTGARDEQSANMQLAPQLAQMLYKAGEGKVGTDESEFNRILASYSFPLLRAVFEEYRKIKGKTICDAIKSEFSGDIRNGLLAVCQCIENKHQFFAKCIHDAMSGMGTRDGALIRLIVTRAEIDLGNIKQEYQKMYGKPLEAAIKSDTSGDYKKMLVALVECY